MNTKDMLPEKWNRTAEDVEVVKYVDLSPILHMENDFGCISLPEEVIRICYDTYHAMVEIGVCPKQARLILPIASLIKDKQITFDPEWWSDLCIKGGKEGFNNLSKDAKDAINEFSKEFGGDD